MLVLRQEFHLGQKADRVIVRGGVPMKRQPHVRDSQWLASSEYCPWKRDQVNASSG